MFNNLQRSGYEEISSYSPKFYKKIREMDAIFRFAGFTTDKMAEGLERCISNLFIPGMEEEVFSDFEKFLKITKDTSRTLEERKAYVNALLLGSGKISKSKIIAIVNQFLDCDVNVALEGSELHINMTFKDNPQRYMADIRDLIRNKVPLHIEIVYQGKEGMDIIVTLENIVDVEKVWNRADFYLYSNPSIPPAETVYLDGSRLLDGSLLLDGRAEYIDTGLILFPVKDRHIIEVPWIIPEDFGEMTIHEDVITVRNENIVTAEQVRNKMDFYIYPMDNLQYLDGSSFLDGSEFLGSSRAFFPVNTRNIFEMNIGEKMEVEPVTIKKNLHYLDGSMQLDGNTTLNSEIWKEDI